MRISKFTRIVIVVIVVLLVITASGYGWVRSNADNSFPVVNGNLNVPGLRAPVDIYRDGYGVPQIYASTVEDLFFSQGYVHAQDRFWQMDFWRHLSAGRLAEMFGEAQVETDLFLRTLGWERVAQQEYALLDEMTIAILDAYAAGVNAYLADRQGSDLSLEYAILSLLNPDYQPGPWTAVNSLAWAKVIAWDLGSNLDKEIEKAILLQSLTVEQYAQLNPAYPEDAPTIIAPGLLADQQTPKDPEPRWVEAINPALREVAASLAAIPPVLGERGAELGSNSWAISGKRSATGMPILANDPHLGVQMPSIWYQIGLHCAPVSADCPFEVAGFSFAGAPGVIIGHNSRIAWGFTNVGPDVQDLYIEKINPDNPNQYEVRGAWVDMTLVEETIQVGGGESLPLTVRYTRNGPIISETYGLLEEFSAEAGIELPEQYALSFRWTALDVGTMFPAIWRFNRAANWDEFREAASFFAVPAQNLLYADVDGNIGYQMPGNIPIRAQGDGTLPVPGWTDEYQWQGYIPFEELPFVFNPPQGYIVTANNAVVGKEYPYLITTAWDYGYRARQIVKMLENATQPLSLEDIQQMQGDNMDLNAAALTPVLLEIQLDDERLEKAREILMDWDFQDHMDSAAAGLFAAFWKHLLTSTFADDLPEDYRPTGGSRWYTVVDQLLAEPDSQWWDDRNTTAVEQRDDIFRSAFSNAVDELEGQLGKDPQKWTWGKLHTVTFRNASLGESGIPPIEAIFNRGPFAASGGSAIVNATGWDADEDYTVVSLPSMRMVVDLGNLDASLTVHTTGQSGHAYHPHYIDMADPWRLIDYYPMVWSRAQVESAAQEHLRLQP